MNGLFCIFDFGMKLNLILIILINFSLSFSQDISGLWTGKTYQGSDRAFYFEMRIDEVKNNGDVTGTTFIREESSGNFGTISFTGKFENGVLHFQEHEIVKEDKSKKDGYWGSNTFYWCIKHGDLKLAEEKGKLKLSGKWAAQSGCTPGTIEVTKEIPERDDVELTDCLGEPASADFLFGLWSGTFKQYSCGVHSTSPMIILIDKVDGLKFSGVFIWTEMMYAEDSRSTLQGEIKDGKIYFYEDELISGSGLVLHGTYVNELIDCNKMRGIWQLDAPTSSCPDKHITEAGGDYSLKHYQIPTVYFNHDQSALSNKSVKELTEFADFMKQFPSIKISLAGHTDNTLNRARSMNLSRERSEIVRDFLVKKGVKANRLELSHYAHTKPASTNNDEAGKALNRRTEIKIISR